MNPRLLPEAADDVADIVDWLDHQPHQMGTQFRAALNALIANLLLFPRMYQKVSRPPRGREIREAFLKRFQYLVHYEVIATEMIVMSVTHAKSNARPWRLRLGP